MKKTPATMLSLFSMYIFVSVKRKESLYENNTLGGDLACTS